MMPQLLHRLRAWPVVALLLGAPAAQAVLITSWPVNTAIPDGNSSGLVSVQSVAADFDRIGRLSVTLEIDRGWMGDLYAYLLHDTGFSVLLNRPGRTAATPFGSGATGLALTFDDRAPSDAHITPAGAAPLSGLRQPDARETDPGSVLDSSPRTAYLSSFDGLNPNGQWTLFVADLAAGDRATLVRWGLEIEPAKTNPVPETGVPLVMLVGVFVGCAVIRRHQRRFLSTVLLLWAGLVPSHVLADFNSYDGSGEMPAAAEEIRWAMNRARFDTASENVLRGTSYQGLPASIGPLAPNASLIRSAQRHAEDMDRLGKYQHETVPGSSYYNAATQPEMLDRMLAEGLDGPSGYGEVIVKGVTTPQQAYRAWWTSAIHRGIFCEPRLREMGGGIKDDHYVVDFAARFAWPRFFTDTLFRDANNNGRYDAGEGLGGLGVSLLQEPAPSRIASGRSAASGGFAVPVPSDLPSGDPLTVLIHNLSLSPVEISVPRSFSELETIAIPAGKSVRVGTFPAHGQDNAGFRHLARETGAPPPGLRLERLEPRPVRRDAQYVVLPYEFVLKNISTERISVFGERHAQSAWPPIMPTPGWGLTNPNGETIEPGAERVVEAAWMARPDDFSSSPYLRRYFEIGSQTFEFIFDVRQHFSVSPQWQTQHGLTETEIFEDLDGDGYLSIAEERLGTHPRQAASRPDLRIVAASPGTAELHWTAQATIQYLIEGSQDGSRWEKLGASITTPGAVASELSRTVDASLYRFFRLASTR